MTETPTKPRLQGRLEWYDSRSIHIQARFDKLAVHQNRLMLISLVAYSQDVKAFRAGLAAGLNVPMRLRDVTLTKDEETIAPNDVWPSGHGYRVDAHRLGYGMLHAIFTCRQPGFLLDDGDDSLWQELKQERFTTPLLRGWLPHVRKELEIKNLLQRCHTFDCNACVLTAMSADLDSIVESGLKDGLITIEPGDDD
jgi:hypothetical protein